MTTQKPAPKTGLRPTDDPKKSSAEVSSAGRASPPASPAKKVGKPQKLKPAVDVATAFAKGHITLAHALGMSSAERDAVKLQVHSWIRSKKADKAIPMLRGLVALDPYDHWPLMTLSTLLMPELEDADVVQRLLERALAVKPNDADTLALRAELRHRTGDAAGAAADLKLLTTHHAQAAATARAQAALGAPARKRSTLSAKRR
jgi:hypothetical protein